MVSMQCKEQKNENVLTTSVLLLAEFGQSKAPETEIFISESTEWLAFRKR